MRNPCLSMLGMRRMQILLRTNKSGPSRWQRTSAFFNTSTRVGFDERSGLTLLPVLRRGYQR
jgi:hypothetical protein